MTMNATSLPFTRDQFLAMFETYNLAIWPMPLVAYLLGIAALIVIALRVSVADRVVSAILAAFWFWLGGVFLWVFMRTIDSGPGPFAFTAAFILQGLIWLVLGVIRGQLRFAPPSNRIGFVGALLIGYAMLVYPILGVLNGHVYPRQPVFGVAPCPTVIFTFGLLLLTTTRVPKYALVIPLAWSVISGLSAPLNYGVYEDFGLLAAGIIGTGLLIWRDRQERPTPDFGPTQPLTPAARPVE
jgi:hypothetical protein